MAHYDVKHDLEAGLMTCRITGALSEQDAAALAADMLAAAAEIRRMHGTVRTLFDNRSGNAFPAAALRLVSSQLAADRRAGERTAILVAHSLNKLRAKSSMSEDSQVFISLSAAMTWLEAWRHQAA